MSHESVPGTAEVDSAAFLNAFVKRDNGSSPAPAGKLPPAPQTIDEVSLSISFLLELVLKVVRYMEAPSVEHIARVICLPSSLTQDLINILKNDRLVEYAGGSTGIAGDFKMRLTERGEERADLALERCRYAGPVPVTLEDYENITGPQIETIWRPAADSVAKAYETLVLEPETADLLERAIRSGRSAMVYGPSGNGKTTVLTEFVKNIDGHVVVPHALYAHGQIIRVFDKLLHQRADQGVSGLSGEDVGDRRWVRIRRPGIIVGGEFTEESLELGYDPVARFYQAPKHLKAQGGVLVVDDFGRQKISPGDLLNRWIMALERKRDNLLLRTGESIEVPFSMTVLFSSNLEPEEIADSAYLRRISYKVYIPVATRQQFTQITQLVLTEQGVGWTPEGLDQVIDFLKDSTDGELTGALPRDLAAIVLDNAAHDGVAATFDVDAVKLAYRQSTGQRPPVAA
jgi:predicted ATPase with chaperone activity